MSSKRLYFLLLAAIILLLVGLVSGTIGANKLLTKRGSMLTAAKAKHQALEQEQQSLTQAKQDVKKYADLHKISKAVVPEDKNQAEAVREIVNIAAANGVSLSAITFPASTLGTTPGGAATGGGTAAVVPVTPSTGKLSQLQPVKNIPGVYQLVITVQSDADKPVRYDKFIGFLSALERNRRTAQVSTITIQPTTADRSLLNFTLGLNEYIKP